MQILIWIIIILVSFGIGFLVFRADQKKAVPYPLATAGLRTLLLFLTLYLLFAPSMTSEQQETQKPIVVLLQDNSTSVARALQKDSVNYRKQCTDLLERLGKDYQVVKWGFGNNIQKVTLFDYRQQATNISAALSQVANLYGQQNLGAVILASDGKFNQGENPAFQELNLNSTLYAIGLGDSTLQKDIKISKIFANKKVTLHSQFEISASLIAEAALGYAENIELKEVNDETKSSSKVVVNTNRFDRTISFSLKAEKEGLHHYIITAPKAEGEKNTSNNQQEIFIEVINEKKKILLLAAAPHPDVSAIKEALSKVESYDIDVRTVDKMPADFNDYQVHILHGLPSNFVGLPQLTAIQKPTWLIMSYGSSNALFNQRQNLVKLNVNTQNLQLQQPIINTNFSGFSLPTSAVAVIDKMPPLACPAGTAQINPIAENLLQSKSNANFPLWSMSQGNTPSALLLGEGIWRWRMFEYKYFNSHKVIDEMIQQTVAFLAASTNNKPFRVEMPKQIWSDQEPILMNAYLLNESNEQINSADASITISDSKGQKQTYQFEPFGNSYRLNIGFRASGTYKYQAQTKWKNKTHVVSGSFAVQSTPLELMDNGSDFNLMHSVSQKYGGAFFTTQQVAAVYDSIQNNPTIKPVIQTQVDYIPLVDWKWYFLMLLLIAVAEWLLRKYWMAM